MHRITLKRADTRTFLIDILDTGSHDNVSQFNYLFSVKKTLRQSCFDLILDSTVTPSQFSAQDPAGVLITLLPEDTQNLLPGIYNWELLLRLKLNVSKTYLAPAIITGDLVLLESLSPVSRVDIDYIIDGGDSTGQGVKICYSNEV